MNASSDARGDRRAGPRRVALTGGIASGKSTVARALRTAGVPVIDADVVAREAVARGTPGLQAVVDRFGPDVLDEEGALDRRAVADRVFADPTERLALEAIVHPRVRAAIDDWFEHLPPDVDLAAAEIPLLFETGRERDFDAVVVVACEPEAQVARLMARNGLSEAEARQRLAAQWPLAEKLRRTPFVIRTDGTHAETEAQLAAVLARLRNQHRV
ncbi:MAG: dephospho-CoA kinase [Vicinamibacterales bacterium]